MELQGLPYEDVITSARSVNLENHRNIYLKNVGQSVAKFGQLTLQPNQEVTYDYGHVTFGKISIDVTFDNKTAEENGLYYRSIVVHSHKCRS